MNSVSKRAWPALLLVLTAMPFGAAGADPWAGAAGGAVVGGIIGGLVQGGTGAAVGVVLGGTMGAMAGKEKQQEADNAKRSASYAEQADWERERRKRNQQLADLRQESWDSDDNRQPSVKVVSVSAGSVVTTNDMVLITDTQRSLIKLGYDPGELGTLSRQTVAVIKLYQTQYDLLETGRPSPQLLRHMRQHGG